MVTCSITKANLNLSKPVLPSTCPKNWGHLYMPFPFSYSKTLVFKKERLQVEAKTLVRNILVGLQKKEADRAHNIANTIYFKGGGFVGSLNILRSISSGKIMVEEQGYEIHVRYKLKFTQLVVYITVVIPIFFGTVLITQTNLGFLEITSFIIFAWLWLVGGNYLSTIIRFPRFIKKHYISSIINS